MRARRALRQEAGGSTAIVTASHRTARSNLEKTRPNENHPTICAIVSRLIVIFILCRALVM
jgi:hypothetical protein